MIEERFWEYVKKFGSTLADEPKALFYFPLQLNVCGVKLKRGPGSSALFIWGVFILRMRNLAYFLLLLREVHSILCQLEASNHVPFCFNALFLFIRAKLCFQERQRRRASTFVYISLNLFTSLT